VRAGRGSCSTARAATTASAPPTNFTNAARDESLFRFDMGYPAASRFQTYVCLPPFATGGKDDGEHTTNSTNRLTTFAMGRAVPDGVAVALERDGEPLPCREPVPTTLQRLQFYVRGSSYVSIFGCRRPGHHAARRDVPERSGAALGRGDCRNRCGSFGGCCIVGARGSKRSPRRRRRERGADLARRSRRSLNSASWPRAEHQPHSRVSTNLLPHILMEVNYVI
jgi:hypothetical protein